MYRFQSRRSTVHSTKGVVSSSQPLASQAGIDILKRGGNAADAAVAVAAVLNLTEPCSTGIGGDMFCLFYDAKSGKVRSLNGSGRSAANLTLNQLRSELHVPAGSDGRIPTTSVHSITVPGAAAGWVDSVEKFGSGKISMEEILSPAINLAEDGFPVSQIVAFSWERSEKRIKAASPNGFEILKADKNAEDGYRAPREGEIMRNPTLAKTFRTLAAEGKDGFYCGRIAKSIIDVTSSLGGHISRDDLEHHLDISTEETTPISLRVTMMDINSSRGGFDVWEHPPNGQGLVALISLGILQELEKTGTIKKWKPQEHNSTKYLHVLIESLRLAFADGHFFITDPAVTPVPVQELLSPTYLSKRAALFSPTSALPQTLSHGSPALTSSDTVYFAVTDAAGNAASFINSNYAGFGTAIVPSGCGFTLQNRGANFSLDATHPNVYAPRKRPYHTIIPALATHVDDGAVASVFGVMGGFMQPQGHVQTLLNQYVFGMSPQDALDAPRFCIGEGMPGADGTVGGTVISVEEGIAEDVVLGLRSLGHTVEVVSGYGRALFGRGQIIKVGEEDGQRVHSAGSDARADGCAIPLL